MQRPHRTISERVVGVTAFAAVSCVFGMLIGGYAGAALWLVLWLLGLQALPPLSVLVLAGWLASWATIVAGEAGEPS